MELCGLIVGLGNPGSEYEKTRHNFGFMLIDALLRKCDGKEQISRLSGQKDPYALWRLRLSGKNTDCSGWLLATPFTYMNRSGEAVQRIAAYYHIDPQNILVLHDELDLPLGRMKLKKGGGNAGHNGLKSLQQLLGTPDYYRLRLGVGKPAGRDGASWVLGRFTAEEQADLERTLEAAVSGVLAFMTKGPKAAQQFCNAFTLDPEPTKQTSSPWSDGDKSDA